MSNEIKNTFTNPLDPLEPMGKITTSDNTVGLISPIVAKRYLESFYTTLYTTNENAALSQSLYKDTTKYKTPAWKIGTQVTYWDQVEKQFILGIIQGAYLRDKEWIYNINGSKVQENHIEEFIETDQQGIIKNL